MQNNNICGIGIGEYTTASLYLSIFTSTALPAVCDSSVRQKWEQAYETKAKLLQSEQIFIFK